MKQAQSETARYRSTGRLWARDLAAPRSWRRTDRPFTTDAHVAIEPGLWAWAEISLNLLGMLWYIVTLPFRLVFWTIAWVGRLTAIVVGFSLMVVGMALWAGPLFFLGIPIFVVGLVLTLRCLD
jgi:hypothetical protein